MHLTFPLPGALSLGALLLVAACDTGPAGPTEISPEAQAYLEEVIGVMEDHSLHRFTIDWSAFRTTVFNTAAGAQTIEQTYSAITRALRLLGDDHSTYRTSGGVILSGADRLCSAPIAGEPQLPPTIGYVRIRPFSGSGADADAYAADIQATLAAFDREDLAGWIVDLRGNNGGNMWPMLSAVGSVLGEDVVGYFVDPEGLARPWEYRDGAAWLDGAEMHRVADPYQLHVERPRVAVLFDNQTIGAGEAIAIAFRERPGSRSFGQGTCGLSTGKQAFTMSDGAILDLTVAVMADRTGAEYGAFIAPDELIAGIDQPVELAVDWLEPGG